MKNRPVSKLDLKKIAVKEKFKKMNRDLAQLQRAVEKESIEYVDNLKKQESLITLLK